MAIERKNGVGWIRTQDIFGNTRSIPTISQSYLILSITYQLLIRNFGRDCVHLHENASVPAQRLRKPSLSSSTSFILNRNHANLDHY